MLLNTSEASCCNKPTLTLPHMLNSKILGVYEKSSLVSMYSLEVVIRDLLVSIVTLLIGTDFSINSSMHQLHSPHRAFDSKKILTLFSQIKTLLSLYARTELHTPQNHHIYPQDILKQISHDCNVPKICQIIKCSKLLQSMYQTIT